MKPVDKLKFWLKIAISIAIPAYVVNFAYALWSGASGGTFGDTFGASNAGFSGLALMILCLGVILQREELALIKEERDETRKLLSGQEKINALQEEALRKQIFEQSFNAMLKVVMDEKSRLYETYSNNGKSWRQIDAVTKSAVNSILALNQEGSITKRGRYSSYGAYFLCSSLFYLDNLIFSHEENGNSAALSDLVHSIIDPSIALFISMYVLERRFYGLDGIKFDAFASKYNVESYLSDTSPKDVRSLYLEMISRT